MMVQPQTKEIPTDTKIPEMMVSALELLI